MCSEHGIGPDGVLQQFAQDSIDRKDVFFYQVSKLVSNLTKQADDDHYIPRAILLDLEPKVIETIQESEYRHLFNPENMFLFVFCTNCRYVPKEGSGAGNNWGVGYSQSDKHSDELLDIITREAEDCDNFEVLLTFL